MALRLTRPGGRAVRGVGRIAGRRAIAGGAKVANAVMILVICSSAAWAQLVNPAAPYQSRLTMQNGGVNAALTVHRNPFGKPCLDIEAASRAHVINPDVYDNVVSIVNKCSKTIRVKVCYFNTDSCVSVEVLGRQRRDVILGVRPHMQYFKYSFQEKF